MQFVLNNTLSLAIKKAPNKALYKFIVNNIINLLSAKTIVGGRTLAKRKGPTRTSLGY
jgi:hypothetical protein